MINNAQNNISFKSLKFTCAEFQERPLLNVNTQGKDSLIRVNNEPADDLLQPARPKDGYKPTKVEQAAKEFLAGDGSKKQFLKEVFALLAEMSDSDDAECSIAKKAYMNGLDTMIDGKYFDFYA